MAEPSLNPAELIQAEGEALTRKLAEIAHQAVADALAGGDYPTIESIIAALQAVAQTLPAALTAALVAELPKIATTAIERASVEIADAREASGSGYPEVQTPEPGDFNGWSATVAAALIASLISTAKDTSTPEAAVTAALDAIESDAPGHIGVMAETATARVTNEARINTFRANSDVVKRLQVVTVHDAKRSKICAHMDGADFNIWAKNIPVPPYHNGCRSFLKPITTVKRKAGATQKEIDRQNWAIFRRLEREAKAAEAAKAEGRALEHLETRLAPAIGDLGVFSGYALTWNTLDRHGTAFAPGAFAASLIEHRSAGTAPVMLWAHDPASPIGTWLSITEDHKGLRVEGKLVTETRQGGEAYALLKAGSLNGLSIGFRRLADRARQGGGRTITAASLQEISLVTIPSNETARITEIRAHPTAPDADHHHHDGVPNTMTTKAATASDETAATETTETRAADPVVTEIRSSVTALNTRLDRLEARQSRQGIVGTETRNEGDDLERRAFTGFLRSGREALGAEEVRSLRVADDASGGYLAPPQFVAEIDKNLALFSPVRSVATVRNTSSGEVTALKRTSPAVATWVGEEEDRPETDIGYGAQNFSVAELSTYVDVSNKLLDDASVDVAAELALEFAEAFGGAEATAFVAGNGIKKPTGFMVDSDIGFTLSGHASQVTADGVIDLYHAVKPAYRQNGVWMANSTTLSTLRKLKDPATGAYLLITGGIGNAPSTTILGRPVIEAPDMPDVGAGAFPLAFGDFSLGYTIWDRIALSIVRDPFTQATKGRTRFHGRRRVAAGVRRAEAIRKLKIAAS